MENRDEQGLLDRARAFDLEALGLIYDRFSPGIYRYAMRLLGEDLTAEECVADTFSRFLKALHAGQGPRDHLQAYLYRIAHNWITDSYRRSPPPLLELDENHPTDDNLLTDRQAENNIKQDLIRIALNLLTPEQKQVIILRFYEGWENEEIALVLNKPVNAIKALQHRAIQSLKKVLVIEENEGIHEFTV